jgi:antitoxin component YwqK of YwqJK toxin-antitoxin module
MIEKRAAIVLMAPFLLLMSVSIIFIGCSRGDLKETFYRNGKINERWYEKHITPNQIVKVGRYESWREDGTLCEEGEYSASGAKTRKWTVWNRSGQKSSEVDYSFDTSGTLQHEWDNGKLMRSVFYRKPPLSSLHGTWDSSWFETGGLNRVQYGCQTVEWYPDGKKKEEREFEDTLIRNNSGLYSYREKRARLYSEETGRLWFERESLNGITLGEKEWDKDGKLIRSK